MHSKSQPDILPATRCPAQLHHHRRLVPVFCVLCVYIPQIDMRVCGLTPISLTLTQSVYISVCARIVVFEIVSVCAQRTAGAGNLPHAHALYTRCQGDKLQSGVCAIYICALVLSFTLLWSDLC